MTVNSVNAKGTPEAQLRSLIEKFDPKDQRLIRSVRSAVRKRLPTANELVYDYRTSVVIGYSPTDRSIDPIVATAASDAERHPDGRMVRRQRDRQPGMKRAQWSEPARRR